MKPSDAPRAASGPRVERLEDRTLHSAFEAHVNFQPSTAPTYPGYARDSGATYAARQGYKFGWNVKNKTFVDRNSPKSLDQRYDTFASLVVNGEKLRWEISVPRGTYSVHIV